MPLVKDDGLPGVAVTVEPTSNLLEAKAVNEDIVPVYGPVPDGALTVAVAANETVLVKVVNLNKLTGYIGANFATDIWSSIV